jgi:hypothetical protein
METGDMANDPEKRQLKRHIRVWAFKPGIWGKEKCRYLAGAGLI